MADPAISVVIAVHNGAEYLEECLESLSSQSFSNFEIVLVEDGSTDETPALLSKIARNEPRLRVLANGENVGLPRSLNRGLDAARGALIARLDADDTALPERLERQHAAFLADPELVLLGANVIYCDGAGAAIRRSDLPLDDETIRAWSLLCNPFSHPAAMMRRSALDAHGLRYDASFETTQDWEFWGRVMACGRVANLSDALVRQRMHSGSITSRRQELQRRNSLRVQRRQAEALLGGPLCSDDAYGLLNAGFFAGRAEADAAGVDRVAACGVALDVYRRIREEARGLTTSEFRRGVVRQCVSIGLMPPLRPGWRGLLVRLLAEHGALVPGAAVGLYESRVAVRRAQAAAG